MRSSPGAICIPIAAMSLACAAMAAGVAELAAQLWPMTAGRDIRAGEPVGVVAGKAVPLPAAGGAIGVAAEGAASNATATVKGGMFLLPAATNLAAPAVGTTVHWLGGEVVADGGTTNQLGRLLFIEGGKACVKIEP